MEDKDNSELDTLIDACLDGRMSEAEADRLSQWIEESSQARQRYWELASVHGMIEQTMQGASLKAATYSALWNENWSFCSTEMACGSIE